MKTLHALIAIAILNTAMIIGVVLFKGAPLPTALPPTIPTPIATQLPTTAPGGQKPTIIPVPKTTLAPIIPTSVPTTAPTIAPAPSNRCIVTIDGARYDLTDFRLMHSGGDIFHCGTDMSATFWGQHGQSMLNRLQRYRI